MRGGGFERGVDGGGESSFAPLGDEFVARHGHKRRAERRRRRGDGAAFAHTGGTVDEDRRSETKRARGGDVERWCECGDQRSRQRREPKFVVFVVFVVVPRSLRNRARIPGIRIVAQGEPFESRRGTARGDRTDHRARGPLGGRLRRRPLRRRHRVAELRVDALHRHANDPSTRRSDPIGTRALGILGTPVLLGTLDTIDRFADDHREDVPGGDEPRRLESTRQGVLDGAASRPRVGSGRRGRDERRGDARGGDDDGARARCGFDDARDHDRDRRRRDRGRPPRTAPRGDGVGGGDGELDVEVQRASRARRDVQRAGDDATGWVLGVIVGVIVGDAVAVRGGGVPLGGDEARESRRAAQRGSDGDEVPGAHAERAEGVGVRADLGVGVAGASGGVGVRCEGNQGTRERRDGDRARGGFARGAPPGGRALGDSRDGTEGGAVVRGVADERARVRVARPRRGETGRENTRLGENDQWWSRRVGHREDASRAGARPAARGVGNADDSQVVGGHHESVDSGGNRSVLRANTTRDPLSLLLRAGLRWRESGARDDRRSTRFPPSSRLTSSPRAC